MYIGHRKYAAKMLTELDNCQEFSSDELPLETETILNIRLSEICQDTLYEIFHSGVRAVRVEDARIQSIWDEVIRSRFWEKPFASLGRHHVDGNMDLGDMLRYVPAQIGYTARKVAVIYDAENRRFRTLPACFSTAGHPEEIPQTTLRLIWETTMDFLHSYIPSTCRDRNYCAYIQLQWYPHYQQECQNICNLLRDSGGRWAQLGRDMDEATASARGPFNFRYMRTLYAICALTPGLGSIATYLNRILAPLDRRGCDDMGVYLGKPHIDLNRALTLLSGHRPSLETEIFDGSEWHRLPVNLSCHHIFPGQLSSRTLGVKPTIHRYSLRDSAPAQPDAPPNVSFLLGAIRVPAA